MQGESMSNDVFAPINLLRSQPRRLDEGKSLPNVLKTPTEPDSSEGASGLMPALVYPSLPICCTRQKVMMIGTLKFVVSLLLRWCCHVGEWMIAGYRTLPVGKMVPLHWLQLQVGRYLCVVVHNRVLIASKLVKQTQSSKHGVAVAFRCPLFFCSSFYLFFFLKKNFLHRWQLCGLYLDS